MDDCMGIMVGGWVLWSMDLLFLVVDRKVMFIEELVWWLEIGDNDFFFVLDVGVLLFLLILNVLFRGMLKCFLIVNNLFFIW